MNPFHLRISALIECYGEFINTKKQSGNFQWRVQGEWAPPAIAVFAQSAWGFGKVVYSDHRQHSASGALAAIERAVSVIDVQMVGSQPFADLAESARLIGDLGHKNLGNFVVNVNFVEHGDGGVEVVGYETNRASFAGIHDRQGL